MHVRQRDASTMSSLCVQSARTQPQPPSPSLTPPASEGAPGSSSQPSPSPPASSGHSSGEGRAAQRTECGANMTQNSTGSPCMRCAVITAYYQTRPSHHQPSASYYTKFMWSYIFKSSILTDQKETNPKPHLSSKKIHIKLNKLTQRRHGGQILHRKTPKSHSSEGKAPLCGSSKLNKLNGINRL